MSDHGLCVTCDKPLSRQNKSGYCARHVSAATARDPAWRERQREGLLRKLRSDPIYLECKRENMRKANASRDLEALAQRMRDNRYWEKSNSARPPGHPSRVRAGRTITETTIGHIPPELRDEYRYLNRVKHIPAAEAQEIILAQHEADMARFRRSIGG